jgi:hypothetical protein
MDKKTPKKSKTFFEKYDLYSDANPKDTIRIKYETKKDVENTIKKLESIYKKGTKPHRRISQIANVMTQRLRVIKDKNPGIDKGRHALSSRYYEFLKSRTKLKTEDERKKLNFKL